MHTAGLIGLYYDGSRQACAPHATERYNHLNESNITLLTRVFSGAPPYGTHSSSPRHESYAKFTREMIENLPLEMITSPPEKHLFGLITVNNNKCHELDPRSEDGKTYRSLCALHARLRCPLVHSVLRFVLDEITVYMPPLFDLDFEADQRGVLHTLANVTSVYMSPQTFEERWGRPPAPEWERQKNKCAGCILARIGSSPNVLVALSAVWQSRIGEENFDYHLRTIWYREWMLAFGDQDGQALLDRSHELGRSMKQVRRQARNGIASTEDTVTEDGRLYSQQSVDSDEETLAELRGTWDSNDLAQQDYNPFAYPAFDSCDSKPHSNLSSEAVRFEDNDYMNNRAEQSLHADTHKAQPSGTYGSTDAAPQESDTVSHRGTVFLDNTSSGAFKTCQRTDADANWVDVCAYMNKQPCVEDESQPSTPHTNHSTWASNSSTVVSSTQNGACTFGESRHYCIPEASSANAAQTRYQHVEAAGSCESQIRSHSSHRSRGSSATPSHRSRANSNASLRHETPYPTHPVALAAKQSATSLYSTASAKPPPLQIRRPAPLIPTQPANYNQGVETPRAPRSSSMSQHQRSTTPPQQKLRPENRSHSVLLPEPISVGSPHFAPRPSFACSPMKSVFSLGGERFRNALRAEDSKETLFSDGRSEWVNEWEWERPHPSAPQVYY
ncbi:MAG: hypothetical protein M1820_005331 [Bogoriella megaspora]|nr:MAG: hypothetical protein M1820_005331 [Bogoriella megaspora]